MAQSNETTITEMNEAIALFDGGEWKKDDYGEYGFFFPHRRATAKDALKYHTSWDWLMPVVEKIAKTVSMLEAPKNDYELDAFAILRRPIYTAISTIHNDVYQLITWLNQQKKTNG